MTRWVFFLLFLSLRSTAQDVALLLNHGAQLEAAFKEEEALPAYQQALAIQQKLVAAHPDMAAYPSALANTYFELGLMHKLADRSAKPASELEKALLVSSEQVHTAAGSHARRLESWDQWVRRKGLAQSKVKTDEAIDALEQVMDSLNQRFEACGRLPWHA